MGITTKANNCRGLKFLKSRLSEIKKNVPDLETLKKHNGSTAAFKLWKLWGVVNPSPLYETLIRYD